MATSAAGSLRRTQARKFFTRRNSIYATFVEQEGPTHVSFRGQGGEELVIAAIEKDGATLVTGSTYLFDMQVARFFGLRLSTIAKEKSGK